MRETAQRRSLLWLYRGARTLRGRLGGCHRIQQNSGRRAQPTGSIKPIHRIDSLPGRGFSMPPSPPSATAVADEERSSRSNECSRERLLRECTRRERSEPAVMRRGVRRHVVCCSLLERSRGRWALDLATTDNCAHCDAALPASIAIHGGRCCGWCGGGKPRVRVVCCWLLVLRAQSPRPGFSSFVPYFFSAPERRRLGGA